MNETEKLKQNTIKLELFQYDNLFVYRLASYEKETIVSWRIYVHLCSLVCAENAGVFVGSASDFVHIRCFLGTKNRFPFDVMTSVVSLGREFHLTAIQSRIVNSVGNELDAFHRVGKIHKKKSFRFTNEYALANIYERLYMSFTSLASHLSFLPFHINSTSDTNTAKTVSPLHMQPNYGETLENII